jgi:quinohemoprotein amine dehydrogenase beta subunit
MAPMNCLLVTICVTLTAVMTADAKPKQDYVVVGAKPDHLYLIDPVAQRIAADFRIPGAHDSIGSIVPSPDGRLAYVLTNKLQSISGIDLSSGKEVFRADLSSADERVTCYFAFDVSPDGKEIVVAETPVKLGLNEYTVEDARFAVFKTKAGLSAKPDRTYPAPRRVSTVLMRKDGRTFFALGFDLYEYDLRTGKQLGVRGVRNWEHANHSIPDVLAVRPVSEPTGVFLNPVSSTIPTADGKGDPLPKTTIMSLDLHSGELRYNDVDQPAPFFSVVKSPSRPEAYGVYNDLTRIDLNSYTLMNHVELDHTYYGLLVSTDGREVYTAGAGADVVIFDSQTLEKKAIIKLPGDQAAASPRLVHR